MSGSPRGVTEDGVASLLFAAFLAAFGTASASPPAAAQGGLVCNVGPADYRHCCRESFRRDPDLDVAGRAADIEACLNSGAGDKPAASRPDRDRGRPAARKSPDSSPPDSVAPGSPARPASPQPPPVVLRGSSTNPIRRIVCASEPCAKGCNADELAISAFCKIGRFPTLTPDEAVRCASPDGATELPTVLFCAKR